MSRPTGQGSRRVPDDPQAEVLAFLARADAYPGSVADVERIDTHISSVFLAGDRVYKLKRARRLAYLDFGTLEKRRAVCEDEVRLNRRTAPDLYLGVGAVVRDRGGGLALAPAGAEPAAGDVVEWLVVMRRFAQEDLFDAMARRGALDESMIRELAEEIARFHAAAERRPDHGGHAGMAAVLDINARAFADAGGAGPDGEAVARLMDESRAALRRLGPLLDWRRRAGFVRRCHGDLHLRNICLVDGRPTLFDAIEFSEELASVDVFYDLAFLLMDLDERRLRPLANLVLNRYLARTGDYAGLATLPLFLAFRATVRSHVAAAAAASAGSPEAAAARKAEATAYLDHARSFLAPPPARLVAVGGLSGTGKSTLARLLAPALGPAPGAVRLRSDVIRKELMGVDPLTRLGREGYAGEVTRRVYATIDGRAEAVLVAGHAAIADAVFGDPGHRRAIEAAASRTGADFQGLWLDAPVDVCARRIAGRRGDASDATVAVLRRQRASGPKGGRWRRVDASGSPAEVLAAARRALALPAD